MGVTLAVRVTYLPDCPLPPLQLALQTEAEPQVQLGGDPDGQ